jgi:small conductance mechanosensitive channel
MMNDFVKWISAASVAAALAFGAAAAQAQTAPEKPAEAPAATPAPAPAPVKKDAPKAVTTVNPAIDIDDLKLIVEPMTRAELETEADAWFALLRAKVSDISKAELAVRRKNREIAAIKAKAAADKSAEAAAPAAAAGDATTQQVAAKTDAKTEAKTDAKTDAKVQLVDHSTKLAAERTAIIDRLKVVLDELDLLGGDTKAMRAYISAVSGLKVEVSDYVSTIARLKAWLTADEGGMRWAKNIGLFLAYVLGSMVLARLARAILTRSTGIATATSHLLRKFIIDWSGRAIVFLGFLAGLSALEVNLAPVLAIIGAAGFVVAFALQGTLSNLASGLLIMINKPFDIGDEIEVGGDIKGRVEAVSIFSTYVVTPENTHKIVPNNTIWSGVIVNHTTGRTHDETSAAPHGHAYEEV